jgi:integrase
MEYMNETELQALLDWTYSEDRLLHLAVVVTTTHGLRISELLSLTPASVDGAYLWVEAEKGGTKRLEPIHQDGDPRYNERDLPVHAHSVASQGETYLFALCRQQWNRRLAKACRAIGIPSVKAHWHALRHANAMATFKRTVNLGSVRQNLRHKSWSAALVYLNENDASVGHDAIRQCFAEMTQKAQAANA